MVIQSFFRFVLSVSLLICLFISYSPTTSLAQERSQNESVLIFRKTEGFRHSSIPTGVEAVMQMADEENIHAYHTEDAGYFHPDSLESFSAVIFLNTTGDVLNEPQQEAFERYMQNGNGFLGIH